MPRIPVYTAEQGLNPGSAPSLQVDTSAQTAGAAEFGALSSFGGKIDALAEHLQKRQQQTEDFSAKIAEKDFQVKLQGQDQEAIQKMPASGQGWTEERLKNFDEQSAGFLAQIPQRLQDQYKQRLKLIRDEYTNTQSATEVKQRADWANSNIDQQANNSQVVLRQNPDQLEARRADLREFIRTAPIPEALKPDITRKYEALLEEASGRGMAAVNPTQAARAMAGGSAQEKTAYDRLLSKGWSPQAAAAIVGGFGAESSFNPSAISKGDNPNAPNHPDSIGIGQWNGDRAIALKKFAAERGKPWNDFETQVDFADWELRNSEAKSGARLSAAKDVREAARAFAGYERPKGYSEANPEGAMHFDRRLSNAQSVLDGKGVAAPDPRFANIPAAKRAALAQDFLRVKADSDAALASERTLDTNNKMNDLLNRINDGKAGSADIEQGRRDGWLTDFDNIHRAQSVLAQKDKATADIQAFNTAAANPAFAWNPVDSTQKGWVDAGFKALGGDMKALQTVAEKTGIVPESASVALQGSLYSNNPQRVQDALQTAANLTGGKYPDIFAGAKGGKEVTDAALAFREYVYGRGMSAADATKKIMEERTPEFERNVKAKIKKEDLDQIVKKQLSDGDIRGAFDPSFLGLAPNPNLGFDPTMRQRAMGDYEAEFRDAFMRNGDVELSKTLAQQAMKRTWGVTTVNGTKTVMKYPPDVAPVYRGIENVSDGVASQAVAAIKEWNGADVDRSKISVQEMKGTAERFVQGKPPIYLLSYTDKNGHVQTIPKAFYADPEQMRKDQTKAREEQSGKIQKRVAIEADMSDLSRANFGVQ